MRRWFVDPLTSFDAGAIALAVAERRKRRPRQFEGGAVGFQEEIDASDAEKIARELTEGVETHLNKTHGKQNVSGKFKMLSSSLRPVSQSNVYSYTNMRQI